MEKNTPPRIGNFALPASQEPGPLLSFGQNIIDKKETQLFIYADDLAGINKQQIDVISSILYQITDEFSIFLNAPIAADYAANHHHSAGLEDVFAQFEYAFYNRSTSRYQDQATVVANIIAPTGSIYKNPPTGAGAASFFLGTTFNRTYVDWFLFGSPGATITTAKHGSKFGNSYFYQCGFGKNIAVKNGWLFAWMIEGDGTYTKRNRVSGIIDPNSGGNVFYVTPSFWASTKYLIFQLGVGFPATQHLYGNQTRNTYLLAANIGWSIY